jgi:hypothetical protein
MDEPISPGLLGTDLEYPPRLPLLAEKCNNFQTNYKIIKRKNGK